MEEKEREERTKTGKTDVIDKMQVKGRQKELTHEAIQYICTKLSITKAQLRGLLKFYDLGTSLFSHWSWVPET